MSSTTTLARRRTEQMDKDLPFASNHPPQEAQPVPITLTQTGNDNTQIAYVQTYDATTNQTVFIVQGVSPVDGTVVGQGVTLNYDCFNLFVLGTEQYDGPTFIVPKDRALTESTSDEMKAQCAALTPEAIEIIKTFPALFCSENHHFAKTDPDHMAYYGYVTDIKVQDNGIKIYFTKLNAFPQQILNNIASRLSIGGARSFNELSRTHWAIKRVNLVEELATAGCRVFRL